MKNGIEIRSTRKRPQGFTLVELLVVIGIIAVLIAILLPAMNKARKQSRTVACMSNVRQICMALNQYTTENKGKFSPYFNSPQIEWMNQTMKMGMVDAVRLCPEATEPNIRLSGGNMLGGAYFCWGPDGAALKNPFTGEKKTGSYGINGFLYRISGLNYANADSDNGKLRNNCKAEEKLWDLPAKNTVEIPFVADAIWDNGWPQESDGAPVNLYDTASFSPMMGRFCVARHGRAVNVGFGDGHVTTVALPDLWRLKWHRLWNPTPAQLAQIRTDLGKLK